MYKKINIGGRKVPATYVPKNLSSSDRKKQIKSIKEGKDRPKLKSAKSKRSSWIKKFEKKYNRKITDFKFIHNNIYRKKGINLTIRKGMAAYYTSGSRPNTNKFAWAYSRLASVILGGPARKVDGYLWDLYKVKKN